MHCLVLEFNLKVTAHMSSLIESVMTVKEVADYLRVNQRTVYRLAVERRLPGFKVGAIWRFKRDDIDHWIAEQSVAGRQAAGTNPKGEGENT